jgi:hypothetical protein
MRIWIFLLLAQAMVAQPSQSESGKALRSAKAYALRHRLEAAQDADHWVWGKDPRHGQWEALALLLSPGDRPDGCVLRIFPVRAGWACQRVTFVGRSHGEVLHISALNAEILTESWCPPLLPGQRGDIPAVPIEYHLGSEQRSSPASVFHPRLGLATVVNSLEDDSKDPAPSGQQWGTHARGESIDLPGSAVRKCAKRLTRWGGRVWFRLDGELYAICEQDWPKR